MPSYNFIGSKATTGSASAYSFLSTQLQIMENRLSADGKLSPGDYDLLSGMARKAYATPGLSAQERNQLSAKLSGYESDKSKSQINDQSNTTNLDNEVKDALATATMTRGNDPEAFLKAKSDILAAKLSQLKRAIDSADVSGSDSSGLINTWGNAMQEYNETTNALQDVQKYSAQPTGQPGSDMGAYITTNSKGEITDVQVGRQGSQNGYTEVKALYGGLPIFGKINTKMNGQSIFKLGTQTFSAPDMMIPDPSNPGAMKSNPLVSQAQQQSNKGYTTASAMNLYVDMNKTSMSPQGFIADQGWAQGKSSSTWYQNNGNGKYTKYINASQKQLNIPDGGYISLPNSVESSIAPSVGTTTDYSVPLSGPVPISMQANTSVGPANYQPPAAETPAATSTPPAATSRTQAPVSRSPQNPNGIAGQAYDAAKGFFSNLFNKSQ